MTGPALNGGEPQPHTAPDAAPLEGLFVITDSGERIPLDALVSPGSGDGRGRLLMLDQDELPTDTPVTDRSAHAARTTSAPAVLHSEQMQDVIQEIPGTLLRWGISVVAAIVVALLALACLIRYPEAVAGEVTLTTPTPPVRLASGRGGTIEQVLVPDQQRVDKGTPLLVFNSAADHQAVFALERELEAAEVGFTMRDPGAIRLAPRPGLGEIQDAYSDLLQHLSRARAFVADATHEQRIAILGVEVEQQQRIVAQLEERVTLALRQAEISQRAAQRDSLLGARQLMSAQEVEQSGVEQLERYSQMNAARSELLSGSIRISELRRMQLEAHQQRDEEERRLWLDLRAAYDRVAQRIRAWRADHLLVAPLNGRVAFFRRLASGQFIAPSEPAIAVLPAHDLPIASIRVSDATASRIRRGQRVILRFENYPASEFGSVEGRVDEISMIANPPSAANQPPTHLISASLPNGLTTAYGRRLTFVQEMRGRAEILTDDLRLIERIFFRLRELLSHRR